MPKKKKKIVAHEYLYLYNRRIIVKSKQFSFNLYKLVYGLKRLNPILG